MFDLAPSVRPFEGHPLRKLYVFDVVDYANAETALARFSAFTM
ncbi:hypothetical protein [Streptomyces iakyrus]